MNRIYSIPDTDCNINENKLKSLIPIAGIRHNLDSNIIPPYIRVSGKEFIVETLPIEQLKSFFYSDTPIETEKVEKSDTFKHFPPSDLFLHPRHFECKTCIFPCHFKKKLFELIIRQNNVACCLRNVIENNPTIEEIVEGDNDIVQSPYMLISLYDEEGLKNFILSDVALLVMIYKHSITNKSNRSKIVWDAIMDMLKSYKESGTITYKEDKRSTVPHQKITLYPVEFIDNLQSVIQDIQYVRYDQIIFCEQVCKQRNICDFINNQLNETRIQALEKEVHELRDKLKTFSV